MPATVPATSIIPNFGNKTSGCFLRYMGMTSDRFIDNIGFLFDLDGVLIDSETEYTRIWTEIDNLYPTGVENFPLVIKGEALHFILDQFYPDPVRQHDVVAYLNEQEQRMHYSWLPGAHGFLEQLIDAGLPRVLVTSSNGLKMKHLREERPDLLPLFDDVVTADRISRSKPDPEGYLLGASLMGVDPRRCVVFEDAVQGVKAGRAAGAYVVGVSTTLPADRLAPYADRVVGSMAEVDLAEIIEILSNR